MRLKNVEVLLENSVLSKPLVGIVQFVVITETWLH